MPRQQLAQLASLVAMGGPMFLPRMGILREMLGGWRAAAEVALSDTRPFVLVLPTGQEMRRIAAGLGSAGLSCHQLLELAWAAILHSNHLGTFITMAEQLYNGDWRAAALTFLAEQRTLERCLHYLPPALDSLRQMGLEVANERGRERVLQCIRNGQLGLDFSPAIPPGAPAAERRSAAAAALEAEGFSATGGEAGLALDRLAAVSGVGGGPGRKWTGAAV